MRSITSKKAARALPSLRADVNKYTRGVCELVVGSGRFPGAAVLAVSAANRMGAGYVKAYTCDQAACALHVAQPSVVTLAADSYVQDFHAQDERHPRATVVGCGMAGTDDEVRRTLDVLGYTAAPVLVDGGGLAALGTAEGAAALRERFVEGYPTVITPHGGEASRLAKALSDRFGAASCAQGPAPAETALALARAFGAVCVLKGPDTFIATGDEDSADDVMALYQGTPALAKAGTGDVLAGAIGALLAQGVPAPDACAAAAFVHARAGMLASVDKGEFCVTAEDVLGHLAPAVAMLAGRR